MALISPKIEQNTSGSLTLTIILTILLAIGGVYLSFVSKTVADAIPRAEAQQMVKDAESRSQVEINKLEDKQDQIMDKLNEIELKVQTALDKKGSN